MANHSSRISWKLTFDDRNLACTICELAIDLRTSEAWLCAGKHGRDWRPFNHGDACLMKSCFLATIEEVIC